MGNVVTQDIFFQYEEIEDIYNVVLLLLFLSLYSHMRIVKEKNR